MKWMIEITELDNAAFEEAPAQEIARILRELAKDFEQSGMPGKGGKLYDFNGNVVGSARFVNKRWTVENEYTSQTVGKGVRGGQPGTL